LEYEVPGSCKILRNIPFGGVLTTTWDRLPEATFNRRGPAGLTFLDEEEVTVRFRESRFFILRLYGDIGRRETFLFTPKDFSRALDDNPAPARTVASMFLTRSILFVGVSLDGIQDFVEAFRTHLDFGSRTHFALVPWGPDISVRAQLFSSRYGIQILPYVASEGHPELETFLAELKSKSLSGNSGGM
jgi:hypothetical protein